MDVKKKTPLRRPTIPEALWLEAGIAGAPRGLSPRDYILYALGETLGLESRVKDA